MVLQMATNARIQVCVDLISAFRSCLGKVTHLDGFGDVAPAEGVLGSHATASVHELGTQLKESFVLLAKPLGPLRGVLEGKDCYKPYEKAEYTFNDVDVTPAAVTEGPIQVPDT
jgi:hypothetical protein